MRFPILEEWQEFKKQTIMPDCSPDLEQKLKRVFYCGAVAVVVKAKSVKSPHEAYQLAEDFDREVFLFYKELVDVLSTKFGRNIYPDA